MLYLFSINTVHITVHLQDFRKKNSRLRSLMHLVQATFKMLREQSYYSAYHAISSSFK